MFQSSSLIDPRLGKLVQQAEMIPGYQVLSAKIFSSQLIQVDVDCKVSQPRRITLLEEFILRGAIEFADPPITWMELATLLSVDPRFVSHTVDDLKSIRILKVIDDQLVLTEEGHSCYQRKQIPQLDKSVTVHLAFVPLGDHFIVWALKAGPTTRKAEEDPPVLPGSFAVENDHLKLMADSINKDTVIACTAEAGIDIHDPSEDRILQRLEENISTHIHIVQWAVLVVYDAVDGTTSLTLRSWDTSGIPNRMIREFEQEVNALYQAGQISLSSLMNIEQVELEELIRLTEQATSEDITDGENRAPIVEKIVQNQLIELRTAATEISTEIQADSPGGAELLRDAEIRPSFLEAVRSAKKRVIIISPWMTEQAVDNELIGIFSALARKRVITLLGWGIARTLEEEEKPPSERLLAKLHDIQTPDGLPAVVTVWLGNQHSKDVIVDDKLHLCGSHNWLSYRGDFQPRGESVYRVSIPEQVHYAAGIIQTLFDERLETSWSSVTKTPTNDSIVIRHLTAWIACGMFEKAASYALELGQGPDHMWEPLSQLINGASERLYGIDPEKRMGLLNLIGEAWSQSESSTVPGKPLEMLRASVLQLMRKAATTDIHTLESLIETHEDAWRAWGIFSEAESLETITGKLKA